MSSEQHYDPATRHWHLDRRINVGHILTTLGIAASAFIWANGMDKRVTVVEAQLVQNVKDNDRQDLSIKDNTALLRGELREMRDELREISRKLDHQQRKTP